MEIQKQTRNLGFITLAAVAAMFFVAAPAIALTRPYNSLVTVSSAKKVAAKKTVVKKPVVYAPRKIDGIPDIVANRNLQVTAVMIDNHVAARPQSGLQSASFVYEALAEGGIPRFMAVFADYGNRRVGPVRSVRPYFAQFASEWRASVVHAGGSIDGLKKVQKLLLLSIEGIKGKFAKFFYRAFGGGVHGLYINTANIVASIKLGHLWKHTPVYMAYHFIDDAPAALRGKDKSGVSIDLGYGIAYDPKYVYDKKLNAYRRFTGGVPHKDRNTNRQITIKNVVVMLVPKEKVLDKKGRLAIVTTGKGKALLLQNGRTMTVTWSKPKETSHMVFLDSQGNELPLIRGNTWITVVPKGHRYKTF